MADRRRLIVLRLGAVVSLRRFFSGAGASQTRYRSNHVAAGHDGSRGAHEYHWDGATCLLDGHTYGRGGRLSQWSTWSLGMAGYLAKSAHGRRDGPSKPRFATPCIPLGRDLSTIRP